jgi:hypothetical protein
MVKRTQADVCKLYMKIGILFMGYVCEIRQINHTILRHVLCFSVMAIIFNEFGAEIHRFLDSITT